MDVWNKQKIVTLIVEQLTRELTAILKSAEAAHGGATHADAVAKSKYDTHGLELSYLAGAQFERAEVLRSQIGLYLELSLKDFTGGAAIDLTAVVELENRAGRSHYFIGINGVSAKIEMEGRTLQVITPQSPLGEELLGLHLGDEFAVKMGHRQQSYRITAVS